MTQAHASIPASAAVELLSAIGHTRTPRLTPLTGGRNNSVWRVDCGNEVFLLKQYFQSDSDPRDRLGQEWAFLEFLRSIGSTKGPLPLARKPAIHSSLLEFIHGTTPQEITERDILDASDFFLSINSRRDAGGHLPDVSEACFSLDRHLDTTTRRLALLLDIEPSSPDHDSAIAFVRATLQPLWKSIRTSLDHIPAGKRLAKLSRSSQCLSPSDFGFHNALRQSDGTLRYLDFEYAGWDDPAKTLIDFTNQPDRILPDSLARIFLQKIIPHLPDPESIHQRIHLLTPVYQFKWACICLNPFLPGRVASPSHPLAAQLARAESMACRAIESLQTSRD